MNNKLKLLMYILSLLSVFVLQGCTEDLTEDDIWAFNQMNVKYDLDFENILSRTNKEHMAPIAEDFVHKYISIVVERNESLFADIWRIDRDLLKGIDKEHFFSQSVFGYLTQQDLNTIEIKSTLTNILDNNVAVDVIVSRDGVKEKITVTVVLDSNELTIINDTGMFHQNKTFTLPFKVQTINGNTFDKYRQLDGNSTIYNFSIFPKTNMTLKYSTLFGDIEETVSSDILNVNGYVTDQRLLNLLAEKATQTLTQLSQEVWVNNSFENANNIFENTDKLNEIFYRIPDIQNIKITEIFMYPDMRELEDVKPRVLSYDTIRLYLKYLVKFDITPNATEPTISSCKDYTWIDLRINEQGEYLIKDMGIDGAQSVLTYLDYTHNIW